MRIDVIIPNYNGANLIKRNLPGVIKSLGDFKNVSIIIVDDGSRKEDVLELRKTLDLINMSSKIPVVLIEGDENSGFSSTVNVGVRRSKADLVLLLNSDVAPFKNFLDPVIKRFDEDPMLFGVGCMDISVEGNSRVKRGRGIAFWKKGMLRHKKGNVDKEDTFWISGGSSTFRRDIYEKLGGMDEIYNPFYWEDIDLSYRAQKSGYKILFEKNSKVEHYHDEGAIKTNYKKNKVLIISYRNQFIFHWKNLTDISLMLSHIFWMPYHLLTALFMGDMNFLKGFILALEKVPDIIRSRKEHNGLFIRRDKDLIR